MKPWRALVAALVFILGAGEACAHASLVSSDPRDGAIVAVPPQVVRLKFDEPVALLRAAVLDDNGANVLTDTRAQGDTIVVSLPAAMRNGSYLVSYSVVSADSHPIAGSVAFSIGAPSVPPRVADETAAEGGLLAPRIVVRALRDAALLAAAGCALFWGWIGTFPGHRAIVAAAARALIVLTIAGVGLHGMALTGADHPLAAAPWHASLRSSFGASALCALLGAVTMLVASQRALRSRRWLLTAGALAACASVALTGHGASAPFGSAAFMIALHAFTAAFWAGSLVALVVVLRTDPGAILPVLQRFSRIAMPAIALLLVAGAGFAALQLREPTDLLYTRYGNLLSAKAALFTALLALAAYNRFGLMRSMAGDQLSATMKLRCSVRAEIALVVAVIGITAILTHTPPRPGGVTTLLSFGPYEATMSVTPARAGHNTIEVRFRAPGDRSFDPVEVSIEISNPGAQVAPLERKLAKAEEGRYVHQGQELSFPGPWIYRLKVRIDDFEQRAVESNIDIR